MRWQCASWLLNSLCLCCLKLYFLVCQLQRPIHVYSFPPVHSGENCWPLLSVGKLLMWGGARRCSLELKILRHLPPTWFYLCLTPSRSAFLQVAASAKLGGSSVGSGDWLPASFMGDLGCVSGLLVDRSWGVNQWSGCLLSLSISVPLKNNDNSNNQMASVFGF